jgi:RNA polymerase sigma-70 factor (ECF subfamily)
MTVTERMLVARLLDRDEDAFNEAVHTYGARVYNLVLRLLGNPAEAEDVAQEVFVTVFKSIESFRGESKFSTWLLRIAANQAKNRIKYLALRTADEHGEEGPVDERAGTNGHGPLQAHIGGPDAAYEAAELGNLLERAIQTLDEDQRLLVVLRDVEELSYDEIVEITGLPEGTVKSRLHRARLAIKEQIERSGLR